MKLRETSEQFGCDRVYTEKWETRGETYHRVEELRRQGIRAWSTWEGYPRSVDEAERLPRLVFYSLPWIDGIDDVETD